MNKKLSILVPTRNRQYYVNELIAYIIEAFPKGYYEVVITDTSDSNELEPALRARFQHYIENRTIVYEYRGGSVSLTKNFNRALEIAAGEYVIFIGDDDGVLPRVLEVVDWAIESKVDVVSPRPLLHYFWPDMKARIPKYNVDGVLHISNFSGECIEAEVERNLRICLGNAAQAYYNTSLPKAYHGIVRRQLFENLRAKTGCYFDGLSPDIYSAIALASDSPRTYVLDLPVTIGGICAFSAAGDKSAGGHKGKYESNPLLRGNTDYEWEKSVPAFYSVETVWADTALKALRNTQGGSFGLELNHARLYAKCLLNYPEYWRETISALRWIIESRNTGGRGLSMMCMVLLKFLALEATNRVGQLVVKVGRRLDSSLRNVEKSKWTGLKTIGEAAKTSESEIEVRMHRLGSSRKWK
jgi:glycosyltransferase involved in cell wall biosynthesis